MPDNDRSGPHLELVREELITRRSPSKPPRWEPPEDTRLHAATLRGRLRAARDAISNDLGGYDERLLIKITLTEKVSPEKITHAADGIEVVSQEESTVVLAFATASQLETFEAKLSSMSSGGKVTYKYLIYALGGFDRWTPEDRTGWALQRHGFPETKPFVIDVELWPVAHSRDATSLRDAFEAWVGSHAGEILDSVRQPYLTVYRIRCDDSLANDLLNHRDVRTVDLPPRVGMELALVHTSIQELDDVPDSPADAPAVVVLDSGLATGHPVIAPAVGDAQSFLPGAPAADEHGHGTLVSGIALYDGAIKPDLVDYGGNMMVDARAGNHPMSGRHGVGEVSTSYRFSAGRPFAEDSGTSFAAPRVAHAAARILKEYPDASVDRCRALLVAHARTPSACSQLFVGNANAVRNVTGYGQVDRFALYQSLESCVTLWAEESIENGRHHFFEIPIPAEFWSPGRRARELTVALAYRPAVRTTRIDYRAAAISFKLVQASSLEEVASRVSATDKTKKSTTIPERQRERSVSAQDRSRGTVQAATWTFKRPSSALRTCSWFVVVTRNDPAWGTSLSSERESYALAVTLADRLVQEPQLYSRIEARLRERARARARL